MSHAGIWAMGFSVEMPESKEALRTECDCCFEGSVERLSGLNRMNKRERKRSKVRERT